MKMSNADIMNSIDVMSELKEEKILGLVIAKNLRRLKEESTEFTDYRKKLFEKYGKIDSVTGKGDINPENTTQFLKELKDALDLEVDVPILTVSEKVFTSGNLTSDQMEVLLWMLEEKKDGNDK